MEDLIKHIRYLSAVTIIWIDGKDGSGKSYLATELAKKLKYNVIHVDDYLVPNQGSYFGSLKLDSLSQAINEKSKYLIVEGICLLKVREALGLKKGFDVYVKKISLEGDWADEGECNISEPPGVYIQRQQKDICKVAALCFMGKKDETIEFPSLAREIITYHYDYKPHINSDATYSRIEQ